MGRFLTELVDQLEFDSRDFFKCIETWHGWYEAQPLTSKRSDPWVGASNIVVPVVRIYSDAVKARLSNTIFGAPSGLWHTTTENEQFVDIARETGKFANWAVNDNECDIFTPTDATLHEAAVLGSAVIMLQWTNRRRYVFMPGEGGKPKPIAVDLGSGPNFVHFPREHVLWTYGKPIYDSDALVTKSPKVWNDLVTLEQMDGVDKGWIEHCQPEGGTSADSGIKRAKETAAGQRDSRELYDIRQAWVEWPVMGNLHFEELEKSKPGTPVLPLLVTFDRVSGTVLRARGKPYFTRGWPAYEFQVRTTSDHRNPAGLAKMLEHIQRGTTTIANQAIDTVTFANSVAGFTTDRRLTANKFLPGRYNLVDSLDSVREAQHGKIVAPDISLFNMLLALAERMTGINDPSLGREIRYGGHPSPATSTALMLQESKELLRNTTKQLRLQISRQGEDMMTLYQQFESQSRGVIERSVGSEDAQTILQSWRVPTVPMVTAMNFDLKAMTEQINPEAEREKAIFVMQASSSFYQQIIQAFQIAAHPNTPPPGKLAAIRSIEVLNKAFEKVLEAGEVDDVRQYILKLKDSNFAPGPTNEFSNALTDRLGQLAADRGGSPLPPIATGAAGVPAASNGGAAASGF